MADIAVYLLRSGAHLALFYALYWLVLRRETFFALNRAFLLGSAALSLALPLLRVPSPFFETVVYASALPEYRDAAAFAAPTRDAGLLEVLSVVYIAGAALLLLLFIVRLGRLALLAGRCGCMRHRGLKVVLCGHPGESFSFFHFVFLNKAKIPEADLDRVLAHELAHVRQLHSFDVVFSELLTVIQWFNPFVWPYRRSLRETHEYLADRAVIAQGCGLARYQLLIVEQHVGGQLLELASSFRTSQIKRRIVMLSKPETKGLARWKPLLILPLAVALVLVFAESRTVVREGPAIAALSPAAQTQAQSVQESKGTGGGQKMSEEEMAKALKEKMAQVEEMKKKNLEMTAKLKAKLEETTDAATREKILAAMKDEKVKGLDIGAKECSLRMKKLEFALSRENDTAVKAKLEKELQALEEKVKDYVNKAEEVRKADVLEKAAGEKKLEKK
ncbi:MAG TPA: M56 family metallopeptidase [Acidobacteriota bacterium]|nr:M56 family metallopeptidase [Acidobacteriota bacterium]